MIRELRKQDLAAVMPIWLDANINAHSFIDTAYWKSNYPLVKTILPKAEVYVYESKNEIKGFIGLTDDYIEGLFVKGNARSKGIGKQLLDYAKNLKPQLSLQVYQKNERAVCFYKRENFFVLSESIDDTAGEKELAMIWNG